MCIPLNHRTLRGGRHDEIYQFFEIKGFCNKYVRDQQFCYYTKTSLKKFKGKGVNRLSPEDFVKIVNCVTFFAQVYEDGAWQKELQHSSVTDFFELMETKQLFPKDTKDIEKYRVSFSQLCYHLGMISVDIP
jgi:hypothetical protein